MNSCLQKIILAFCLQAVAVHGQANVDPEVKTCNSNKGECVPYYLCSDHGKIITDGNSLIDERFGENGTKTTFKERVSLIKSRLGDDHTFDECDTAKDFWFVCCEPEGELKLQSVDFTKLPTCGKRNEEGYGINLLKIEEGLAEYAEFPWMLAVMKKAFENNKLTYSYSCGASLIHPKVALTAAHCVRGKAIDSLIIRAGEWDTQGDFELVPATNHDVSEIVVHDKFYKGGLYNDIALVFLKTEVKLAENANTVCLPPQDFNFDGAQCYVTGWGKNLFGKNANEAILKKIDVPAVNFLKCQDALRKNRQGPDFQLHSSFMCAGGEKGKDACNGDGGSPLVCPVPGQTEYYYQAGIVAWGIECGKPDVPGVYVDVGKFRTWIDEQMTTRSLESKPYTWK